MQNFVITHKHPSVSLAVEHICPAVPWCSCTSWCSCSTVYMRFLYFFYLAILKPYNQCDYTKKSIRQWFWIRLIQSLSAPTNGGGGYEGPVDPPRLGRDIHKDYKAYNGGSSSNQGGHGDKKNRNRSSTAPAELSKTSGKSDQFEQFSTRHL